MIRKIPLLVLYVATSFLGCAYFNTFYNAESIFREANTEHLKLMRNFPDSLVTEPTSAIKTKYDRAIEKSIKVLEVFPKDKKLHDDALFMLARSLFYKKEMSKAIVRFKELQNQFPQSPFVPESYLYICKAFIELGDLVKAEEILNFAEKKLSSDSDAISLLRVEIAIRREGKGKAVVLLETLQKRVRSPEQRLDLILRTSELYIELGRYEKAIALLKQAPRKKEFPLHMYRVDRALINAYSGLGSYETGLQHIQVMLKNRLYSQYRSEIQFEKAMLFKKLKRFDDAIALFTEIAGPPDSTGITDTSGIVGKASYQLALMVQHTNGDYQKARLYYRRAAGTKDTSTVPLANRKLKALDLLEQLRSDTTSSDSLKPKADKYFKIAELFKYELEQSDSSMEQFLLIWSDTTNDSTFRIKSLFAAGFIARNDLLDTLKSDSLLRIIISNFSSSDYAYEASRLLNVQSGITSRTMAAQSEFVRAEKLYTFENDVKSAVKVFYDIYKNFPELEIAPKSLYVAAWLIDNEMQKNKTAQSLYERLCEKYPESIYCKDEAKPRLKIVNDTLESIRSRKVMVEKAKTAGLLKKNKKTVSSSKEIQSDQKTANESASDTSLVESPDLIKKEMAEPTIDSTMDSGSSKTPEENLLE